MTSKLSSINTSPRPAKSLLSLPYELLVRIAHTCNGATLQGIRASCKTLQQLVEPILFHTIVLYPHLRSADQITELSRHPIIRNHVKCLIYDLRYCHFSQRLLKQISSRYNVNVTAERKSAAISTALAFQMEVIDPSDDQYTELLLMLEIVRNLFLEQIVVLERAEYGSHRALDIDNLPKLYRDLRSVTVGSLPGFDFEPGCYEFDPTYDSAMKALLAAGQQKTSLRLLEMYNVKWDLMLNFTPGTKDMTPITNMFAGLKSLTLNGIFETDYITKSEMINFNYLMANAVQVEYLDVSFGKRLQHKILHPGSRFDWERFVATTDSFLAPLLGVLPAWSIHLKALRLSGIRCYRYELMAILKGCKKSLKSLSLGEITLLPPGNGGEHSCLVVFLKTIASSLELREVFLEGLWSNTGRQLWKFEHPYDVEMANEVNGDEEEQEDDKLKTQIEYFLCHGGQCPLEQLALFPSSDAEYQARIDQFELARAGEKTYFHVQNTMWPESDDSGDELETFYSDDDLTEDDMDDDDDDDDDDYDDDEDPTLFPWEISPTSLE